MANSFEVLNEISRYLRGEQNAQSLRHWMVGAQLQNEGEVEPLAERLLSEVDGLFAQFSDGFAPESFVRQELTKLLLSGQIETQSVLLRYYFLKPSFANPVPKDVPSSNEAETSALPNL